ncbi:hypothetical protein VIGAN_11234800 [Vigna angularis var. angularis]|uniref:Uncharacterized protein n=1 Tax=Vigna angularis var. angularis TaxID=157739 RepID=A0A0S3TCR0_PHAAN|nr:hypothetical protein VIGAN_11234800 [Vigna angularis var. angularis]
MDTKLALLKLRKLGRQLICHLSIESKLSSVILAREVSLPKGKPRGTAIEYGYVVHGFGVFKDGGAQRGVS